MRNQDNDPFKDSFCVDAFIEENYEKFLDWMEENPEGNELEFCEVKLNSFHDFATNYYEDAFAEYRDNES